MTDAVPIDATRMESLLALAREGLPGLVGVEIDTLHGNRVTATMRVHGDVMAPNGFLHAASVVALADTACGFGCWAGLRPPATGFTTLELKANFVGTAREGTVSCEARRIHGGRTTEVWDATVAGPDGRAIALFRCTQLILRPQTVAEAPAGA